MSPSESRAKPQRDEGVASARAKAAGALVASAAGDALGWPQEMRTSGGAGPTAVALRTWLRRTGGRFHPHDETIEAGEYSDDTQMTLALARARLSASDWWSCLTRRELPLLTLYQRGAGAAVLRACGSWRKGMPPWKASDEGHRRAYFEAGANGVAMRVLPHAIWHLSGGSFEALAHDVVRDGIATHGHPRALVGALLYAHAAFRLLGSQQTLSYGQIVETLLATADEWGAAPLLAVEGWVEERERLAGSFRASWQETVNESIALLQIAREGLARGALADDREVMERLGCFGRWKGAGTITTVAAIYLASRHAAQPRVGVLTGAFALGADTDTLAALTGGLLGALGGRTWLPAEWLHVQDAPVLDRVAEQLLEHRSTEAWEALSDSDLRKVQEAVTGGGEGEVTIEIDRALSGKLLASTFASLRGRPVARVSKLALSDGQTVYLKRFMPKGEESVADGKRTTRRQPASASSLRGMRLVARDLASLKAFYVDVIGLRVSSEANGCVSFGMFELIDEATARSMGVRGGPTAPVMVVVECNNPDDVAERVEHFGGKEIARTGDAAEECWFRCYDPEGNVVEAVERPARRK